jgi:hypothetical protein
LGHKNHRNGIAEKILTSEKPGEWIYVPVLEFLENLWGLGTEQE